MARPEGPGNSFTLHLPLDESGGGGADGEEATEEALEPKRPTLLPRDVILTDLMMPHPSGSRPAERARRIYPRVPVPCISGYLEDLVSDEFPREGVFRFLQKPFTHSDLLELARTMTGRAAGRAA